jgi:glutaredoxin 2
MQLYYYEHCPFCAKVRLLAGLKNIPLSLQVVSADDVDTCVSLVGRKVVPVLIKAEGLRWLKAWKSFDIWMRSIASHC